MFRVAIRRYTTNRSLVNTYKYKPQDQLYIHEFANVKKVSFSEDPYKLHIGTLKVNSDHIDPSSFVENKDFLPVLHEVFGKHVYDDQAYIYDALNYGNSFMAISDYKVILDYMNQKPDMQNTIGFVHVKGNGVMDVGSYEKNDTYTLCNINGIIKISEFMNENLQKYLN